MAGGNQHEHISQLRWEQDHTGQTGTSPIRTMIDYVRKNGSNSVYCKDQYGTIAYVHINKKGSTEYLQTYADQRWTDNLLALPEV